MEKLSANFIPELFKMVFMDKDVLFLCKRYLKYQFIPKEMPGYKVLLREAVAIYDDKNIIPSLGFISQKFSDNDAVQEAVDEIKETDKPDKELIISQLEAYVKKIRFKEMVNKIHDLYEENKVEEAIFTATEESKEIHEISLRNAVGNFKKVFRGFEERMKQNREFREKDSTGNKVTFGIDVLDEISYGGIDKGDTVLWILRSGEGKSTVLKWHGYRACMDGKKVLHIQLEGGVSACLSKYDQIVTGHPYMKVRKGELSEKEMDLFRKTARDVETLLGSDIEVYGFEKYGEASMMEVRNIVLEYYKAHGYFPDELILDSLDLAITGENAQIDTNPNFLKYRLQKNAQRFKDICNEFHIAGITATQASNVPVEIWNSPDRVIDRSYTEGDKTLVKTFSYVFTGNRTQAERDNNRLRIYTDKLRDFKQVGKTYLIATNYNKGAFYNAKETIAMSGYLNPIEIQKVQKKEKLKKENRVKNDV